MEEIQNCTCTFRSQKLLFWREHILKWRKIETAVLCLVHRHHLFIGLELIVFSCTWDTAMEKYNQTKERHWQWQNNNILSYNERMRRERELRQFSRECSRFLLVSGQIFKKKTVTLIFFFLSRNLIENLIFWDENENIFLSISCFETRNRNYF